MLIYCVRLRLYGDNILINQGVNLNLTCRYGSIEDAHKDVWHSVILNHSAVETWVEYADTRMAWQG